LRRFIWRECGEGFEGLKEFGKAEVISVEVGEQRVVFLRKRKIYVKLWVRGSSEV
jgi:hypothetical protein